MAKQKADLRPFNVKRRFSGSLIPLVNGKYLIKAARKGNGMIMATNIRCRLPVEGIVRASMATRAPVMYEIAKSEMSLHRIHPRQLRRIHPPGERKTGEYGSSLRHPCGSSDG